MVAVGTSWLHVRQQIVVRTSIYINHTYFQREKEILIQTTMDLTAILLGISPNECRQRNKLVPAMTTILMMADKQDGNTIAQIKNNGMISDDVELVKALVELDIRLTDMLVDELVSFVPKGEHAMNAIAEKIPHDKQEKKRDFEAKIGRTAFQMTQFAKTWELNIAWLQLAVKNEVEATAIDFGLQNNLGVLVPKLQQFITVDAKKADISKCCDDLMKEIQTCCNKLDHITDYSELKPAFKCLESVWA